MNYKLSELCEYVKGKVNVEALNSANYVSTENMLPNKEGIVQATTLPSLGQTQIFKSGDVLVSNIRPYFRKIWYAQFDGGCSNDVLVFRAKEGVNDRFLYYVLANDSFFDYSMATSKGTKMPRGDKSSLMKYEIRDVAYKNQDKIAEILEVLDQKIQVNKQINDNLQQQAQAIYKHLIVNNSQASWTPSHLSDIAIVTMGQSPKGESYNEEGTGTIFFQGRAEFGFRFPTRRMYTTEPKRMANANDVLMSVRAPVGDINVAYEDCCIGRGLGSIRSKDGHQSFILYTMLAIREQLDVFNGEGTVFGSINRDALNSLSINIPPIELVDQFESIVAPMDATIRNNYDEICNLQVLRDNLLPKLMSGEIDVSDIEL